MENTVNILIISVLTKYCATFFSDYFALFQHFILLRNISNIRIPRSGIFIGVEWLIIPDNKYNIEIINKKTNKKFKREYYLPELAATKDTLFNALEYVRGTWVNSRMHNYVFGSHLLTDPAISIILTN